MNNETIERVEIKIAFLENANNELSAVVYRQQQQIDALHLKLAGLTGRLEEIQNRTDQWTAEQERPPHY